MDRIFLFLSFTMDSRYDVRAGRCSPLSDLIDRSGGDPRWIERLVFLSLISHRRLIPPLSGMTMVGMRD